MFSFTPGGVFRVQTCGDFCDPSLILAELCLHMQTYEDCKSLRLVGSDEVAVLVIDVEYSSDVLDSGTTETGNTRPVTSEQCGH